jgi:hypothetical protein
MQIDNHKAHTHFVVLERVSLLSVSVTWSDPTLGHFADQLWIRGSAHIYSFCALTGLPICPGDAVFRPRPHDLHVPENADRMILESSLSLRPSEA